MEARDFGIGVVMIIPTFVGGGAIWQFFHSWSAVSVWIIVMAVLYGGILYKKYSKGSGKSDRNDYGENGYDGQTGQDRTL